MRALLKTFEEKRQLIELLTTRAQASGDVLGVLGIVGPRRLPYAKIVPLVEYTRVWCPDT